MKRAAVVLALLLSACPSGGAPATRPSASPSPPVRILVFTKTAGFKHASIRSAAAALKGALQTRAIVDVTADPAVFTGAGLEPYRAVVFLLTTGDVLTRGQELAFESYIAKGRGFAGVHSATDTEYGWSWYHELIGATFKRHPKSQKATVRIVDPSHPSMSAVPSPWVRTDEWYDFRVNPRAAVHVLAVVDESTYVGGTMGRDHPISWCRAFGGGHAWYTALGHGEDAWRDPVVLAHVTNGVISVARDVPAGC